MNITIYTGNYIVELLNILDINCEFIKYNITPNTINYHFKIKDLKSYKKIKNAIPIMEMHLHDKITQINSDIADFCLSFVRKERECIKWESVVNDIKKQGELTALIGVDEEGKPVYINLKDMVSALCVGTSGSGKSNFLHSFICSLLLSTNNIQMLFIDIKRSELVQYEKKLDTLIHPVAKTTYEAKMWLKESVEEMYMRYKVMEDKGISSITNEFPHRLIVIDELAELMLSNSEDASEIENYLVRLCQLGRACGIHCLLCTQSPRVKVVSGLIQSNTPTKFALRTSNVRESMLAINKGGCEKLLGKGDMIFKRPDSVEEFRVQVPYISPETIKYVQSDLLNIVWK